MRLVVLLAFIIRIYHDARPVNVKFLSVWPVLSVAAVCIGMCGGGRRFRVICSA